jgi:hypothetical protein
MTTRSKRKPSKKVLEIFFFGFYFAVVGIFSNFAANWFWELFGKSQMSILQAVIGGGSLLILVGVVILLLYKHYDQLVNF